MSKNKPEPAAESADGNDDEAAERTARRLDAEPEAEDAKPAKEKKEKPPRTPKPAKNKGARTGIGPLPFAVPLALVAGLALAYFLPPTHGLIMKSPLGPLLARFDRAPAKGLAVKAVSTPDPSAQVRVLNDALASEKTAGAQKDRQIAALQAQVKASEATPPPTEAPLPKPTATSIPEDVKRTATYWANMDADKAADIIKQLPDTYVEAVLSQMPPDAVADIMSALPPKTAARLTADSSAAP